MRWGRAEISGLLTGGAAVPAGEPNLKTRLGESVVIRDDLTVRSLLLASGVKSIERLIVLCA